MDNLKKALDRFRAAHETFLEQDSGYSLGYGYDPERRGAPGIIVYAMNDDEESRTSLLIKAKKELPDSWEGHPVYLKGMSVPRALSSSR